MSPVEAREPAELFAALGDPTRLGLLSRLAPGRPQSITALSGPFPVSRQAITKHLAVLEEAGLVRSVRQGRERLWRAEPERLEEARRHLEAISRQWDEALERLKRWVED